MSASLLNNNPINIFQQSLKGIAVILLLGFLTTACDFEAQKTKTTKQTVLENKQTLTHKTAILFNQKCMICHITEGKTAETMLAPPFYEVKERYLKAAMDKDDFVAIMSNWVKNPAPDNVLIPDAVTHFGIMPNLTYSDQDIIDIVHYIYDNEMPKPNWFDAHEMEHLKEHEK